jgi:hypothetical protein
MRGGLIFEQQMTNNQLPITNGQVCRGGIDHWLLVIGYWLFAVAMLSRAA